MTDFNAQLPVWNKTGVEPPNSKKRVGWQADERPPAEYLNWLNKQTYESLLELQQNATHKDDTEVIASQLADIAIDVTSFGAVGNGTIDDTVAFNSAKSYVLGNGGSFYVPPKMTCYLPNGFDFFGLSNIDCKGTLKGSDVSTSEFKFGLRSGVSTANNIVINNVENAKIVIQGSKNGKFTLNRMPHLLLLADGSNVDKDSLAYNNFYLGKVDKVELNSVNGYAWINENKFFGGRITTLIIDGSYPHNHNIFTNPTLENSTIDIRVGSNNRVENARLEGTNTITFGNGTYNNVVSRSWYSNSAAFLRGTVNTPYTDSGKNNSVINAEDRSHPKKSIYELNSLSRNFKIDEIIKETPTQLSVVSNGLYKNTFETGMIEVKNDFGMEMMSDAAYWRMYVECYDATGTLITTQPTDDFISSGELRWISESDKFGATISRNSIKLAIFKHASVKFVKIYIQPHSTGSFKRLSVYTRFYTGFELHFPLARRSLIPTTSGLPNAGSWEVGDKVEKLNPTPGTYIGYVCTTAGIPGTWKGYGLVES